MIDFYMNNERPIKVLLVEIFDLVSYIIFVGGIVFFIKFFLINPFNVHGSSMYPTIHDQDFILVDKISQRFKDYQRGDMIVFVPPQKTDPYVKRIIGLPGETVTIRDNIIQICKTHTDECFTLHEEFLPQETITTATCGKESFEVTEGYFVMGDNRQGSTDSRCCFGRKCFEHTNYLVPKDHILGKVTMRLYPDITIFKNPLLLQ